MSRIGWVAALCLLWVHGVAQAQSRAGPEPAPIEAYGRLPAFERAQLSDSGDRLAVIKTEGDERFVLNQSLPDAGLLGGARIGDVKVRDLVWVDDEHVLIVTSSTQRWPSGVDIEAFSRQIYSLQTSRLIGARFDDPDGERYAFIDPAAGRALRSILAAFEGYRPRLRSWSHDMRRAVAFLQRYNPPD